MKTNEKQKDKLSLIKHSIEFEISYKVKTKTCLHLKRMALSRILLNKLNFMIEASAFDGGRAKWVLKMEQTEACSAHLDVWIIEQ